MLQTETIEELKALKNKMRDSISIAPPIASQARAIALFNSIEPHLNVNDRGEVITDENDIISSSRYEDLINYATRRKRRQDYVPAGWDYFLKLLKKYNVPKFSLNHETLKEIDSVISNIVPKTALSKIPIPKQWMKSSPKTPSKIPIPKQWMKSSPKTSPPRGRTPKQSQVRAKRKRAPPKKFSLLDY